MVFSSHVFIFVFLPLTFITGLQNFAWLVDNITGFARFAVLGIGGLLITLTLLWAWMRRNRRATATAETRTMFERAAAVSSAQPAQYRDPDA